MLFDRWNGIDRDEFREHFGFSDIVRYDDQTITKAIRYGCERADLESGNTISAILGEGKFPGGLTKNQEDTVLEAASGCANHMIKQGLDGLRGSASVSMGQISTGQTNPDEPDYFPPFLRNKLVGAGLVKFIHTGNIPTEKEYLDPARYFRGKDEEFFPPSIDFLKRAYVAKKGQGSLESKDKTVTIKPAGGVYDGVDLSIQEGFDKFRVEWELFQGKIREIVERLKIDLKQGADNQDKKIELIGEAFGKLNKLGEDFKKTIDKDITELKEDGESMKEVGYAFRLEMYDAFEAWKKKFEAELRKWILEELKKDKYRGPRGEVGARGPKGPKGDSSAPQEDSIGEGSFLFTNWDGEKRILYGDQSNFSYLNDRRLRLSAVYNSETGPYDQYTHVISLAAHLTLNLKEFKRYGIIDSQEGKREKPEEPREYDKLTAAEKKEIEPVVTRNYFQELQVEVASLQKTVATLQSQLEILTKKGR